MERSMEDLCRKALDELFRKFPYLFEWLSPDLRRLLKEFFEETQKKAEIENQKIFKKFLEKALSEECNCYDY